MSIGNLKTDGGKGTNWPWQYRVLLGLDKIAQSLKDGTEFESELVTIDCSGNPSPPPSGSDIIRLEVRVWDTDAGEFTSVQLYEVGSATPDLTDYSGCTKTYLSGDATEATLQAVLAELKDDLADEAVIPVLLRKADNAVAGTPDTITDAVKAISFANYSSVEATIYVSDNDPTAPVYTPVTLKPGEVINLDAGGNANAFPASMFQYEPDPVSNSNGDLLITYTK
tara:strand:- start:131 stop:805 length:675 start_codon:yes stop_codon:yes gene_type:complete